MRSFLFILSCIFLSSVAFGYAENAGTPLFEMDGKKYSFNDLSNVEKSDFYKVQYQNYKAVSAILEEVLLEEYFNNIATKKNISVNQAMEREYKVADPTEKEMKKYYEERKSYLKDYSYDQLKYRIKEKLTQSKMLEKRTALLEKLKKKQGFNSLIKEPTPVSVAIDTKGLFSKGNPNSKVTVIEFCSYGYGFCKYLDRVLENIVKKEKINLVFAPVVFPQEVLDADLVKAGFCADAQGKYWKFHDLAYEKQGSLSKDSITKDFPKKLKLDASKFETCLSSTDASNYLNRIKEFGTNLEINKIPALFINNKVYLESIDDEKAIAKAIEKEKIAIGSKK